MARARRTTTTVAKKTAAAKTTTARRHPAQREDIERWLEEHGVKWSFIPDVPVSDFDIEKSMRNQARITQTLNEERVETYTEAMERGDQFPAVVSYVLDKKFVMMDGNHRLQAAINSGKPLSTYVVDKDTDATVITILTYEANAKHGLPNSVEDRQYHAVYLIRSGATSQENAAAALNLSKSQVSRAWNKSKADDRAASVGLLPRQWSQLSPSVRIRLNNIRTDEGFEALADLAIRADFTVDEVARYVTEVNRSTRSAVGQKKYVEDLKDAFRSRIQSSGGGLMKGRKAFSSKHYWMLGVGQLIRLSDDVKAIVADVQEPELDDAIDKAEMLSVMVTEVLEGLKEKKGS